jgi:hypothetical protein
LKSYRRNAVGKQWLLDGSASDGRALEQQKSPVTRAFVERMMGLEPTTFCMASRRSSQLSYIRERRQV